MIYRDGEWSSIREWSGIARSTERNVELNLSNAEMEVFVRPTASIELYRVGGPVFKIERAARFKMEYDYAAARVSSAVPSEPAPTAWPKTPAPRTDSAIAPIRSKSIV